MQGCLEPSRPQTVFNRTQVTTDHGHHASVQDCRDSTLVFADFTQHFRRQRNRQLGRDPLRDRLHPLLVGGVGKTMQKTHCNRTHPSCAQLSHHLLDLLVLHLDHDLSSSIHALANLGTQRARHDRIRPRRSQVIEIVAQLTRDLDHITKPFGGD